MTSSLLELLIAAKNIRFNILCYGNRSEKFWYSNLHMDDHFHKKLVCLNLLLFGTGTNTKVLVEGEGLKLNLKIDAHLAKDDPS